MKARKICVLSAVFAMLAAAPALALDQKLLKDFSEALETSDAARQAALIKDHKDRVPAEVRELAAEAEKTANKDDRERDFYLAERMAHAYNDATGNPELLKEVKKRAFEVKLAKPVHSKDISGVHTVEALSTGTVKNIFRPDNIIIKKGETVRFVNNDDTTHIFASVPFLGLGGIFSPNVDPGQSWEYRFNKPGEYYYICFIHKVMYGKITVEE